MANRPFRARGPFARSTGTTVPLAHAGGGGRSGEGRPWPAYPTEGHLRAEPGRGRRIGSVTMREILTVLESDAHASVERIATLTGIDEAGVREQIAAWEASGVIRRYKTVVDWDRYGDERVTAFVDVTVAPERGRGFDDVAE